MTFNTPIREWRGSTVWVIGASTGIGRATALALRDKGANVYVSARNAEGLARIVGTGPGITAIPLDATDAAAVASAFRQIIANGKLDLIFYCAGHYHAMRAATFNLEDATHHMDVNYVGALNVLGSALPYFLEKKSGHICLTGSVAGYRGLPESLAYGPTKAALINLAESLYGELNPMGIGVSIVNPGFVETPLTSHNEFHMPALISAETASQEILSGWRDGLFEIHFPKRFTRWMKALQLLPYGLGFPLIRKFTGM